MKGGPEILGRVKSLHLHPDISGEAFQDVESIEIVAGKGILGNPRYFNRSSRRHVTLIEREQIAAHAGALGLSQIPQGKVRSNIETTGIDLIRLIGQVIRIGDSATLFLYEPRKPCAKMDAICHGLRALMEPNRQGMVAEVKISGAIRVGDPITVVNMADVLVHA